MSISIYNICKDRVKNENETLFWWWRWKLSDSDMLLLHLYSIELFSKTNYRSKSGNNVFWWFSTVKRSSMKSLIFQSRAKNRKKNTCKNIRPIKAQQSATKSPNMHFPRKYMQTPNIVVSSSTYIHSLNLLKTEQLRNHRRHYCLNELLSSSCRQFSDQF